MTENKNVELVEVPELTQRDKVETYFRSTFLLGSFNFERYAVHRFRGFYDSGD